MGKRGPAPEPTALKAFKGNPGKRPLNGDEPQFPPGTPTCPEWLGDIARAKWFELLGVLTKVPGLLRSGDGEALALYCEAYEEMRLAQDAINQEGMIVTSEKGGRYQHPAVGIKNRAIQRMGRIGALFGLSPSDRAALRIKDEPPKTKEGKSRFFA